MAKKEPTVNLSKYGIGEYGEIYGSLPDGVSEYEVPGATSEKILYAERKKIIFNDQKELFLGGLTMEQLAAGGKDVVEGEEGEVPAEPSVFNILIDEPSLLFTTDKDNYIEVILPSTAQGAPGRFEKYFYDHSKDPIRSSLGALWIYVDGLSARPQWIPEFIDNIESAFESLGFLAPVPPDKGAPLLLKPPHPLGINYEPYTIEMINDEGVNDGFPFKNELLRLTLPDDFHDQTFANIVARLKDISAQKFSGLNYADYVFERPVPFDDHEVKNFHFQNAPLYVKHRSDYNFYISDYEKAIGGLEKAFPFQTYGHIETILPNLNMSLLEGDSLDPTEGGRGRLVDIKGFFGGDLSNEDISDLYPARLFVTLGGKISDVFKDILNEKGEKIGENDSGQYFEKWTRKFKEYVDDAEAGHANFRTFWPKVLIEKNKNYIFTNNAVDRMHKHYGKRFLFPMFNEIEFSTTRSGLADVLSEAKMATAVLRTIVEGNKGIYETPPTAPSQFKWEGDENASLTPYTTFLWSLEDTYTEYSKYVSAGSGGQASSFILYGASPVATIPASVAKVEPPEINLVQKDWISSFIDYGSKIFFPAPNLDSGKMDSLVIAQNSEKMILDIVGSDEIVAAEGADNSPGGDFMKNLLLTIFQQKLAEYARTHTRTFRDILQGKIAHSETVFYRIEKVDSDGNVIQNFYFLNSSENEVIKFVDTQILYGKTYRYNIYVWQAVFGTSYEYVPVEGLWGGGGNTQMKMNVISSPSVKMIEFPYYSFEETTIDSPPVYPDINIIPYRGINNKLLINMNSNSGQVEAIPICCFEDQDAFVIEAQWKKRFGSALTLGLTDAEEQSLGTEGFDYGSPEYIARAQELYNDRLSKMPILFESDDPPCFFELYRLDKQPLNYMDFKLGKKKGFQAAGTSVSFVDTLQPNKKYYYTFRVKDVHGHSSNPTPIFEVELVDNGGAIYLLQKVVTFDKPAPGVTKKPMKRYLAVIPATGQSTINLDESDSNTSNGAVAAGTSAVGGRPKLGILEERLFANDKVFKIRLTSRTTGKKVDFNLKFKTEHFVTEQEENVLNGKPVNYAEVSDPSCAVPVEFTGFEDTPNVEWFEESDTGDLEEDEF